ncbi:MAG: c-type cytochrome domain-containing protein [Bradyrhizobium sp.]
MRPLLLGIAAIGVAIVATAGVSFNAAGQGAKAPAKRAPTVSFREDIVPIFKGRCIDCHKSGGSGFEASGLDLSSYEGVMKGTKFGPMVIAGDADASNLMRLLDWRVDPKIRMPHGAKKLSVCDRDAMRRWIMEGAQNN